jgi:hypothetical protein
MLSSLFRYLNPKRMTSKDLKYAYAMASNIVNLCIVTIWIRGKEKDTRVIRQSKKNDESTLCAVYIYLKRV